MDGYDSLVIKAKEIVEERYSVNERGNMSDNEFDEVVEEIVDSLADNFFYSMEEQIQAKLEVYSSFRGLGILDSIIRDKDITEVMINGPENIFVEKSGRIIKLDKSFENIKELRRIIEKVVSKAGREVNDSNPIVDTRLEDGSRVNVVLNPVAMNGPIFTIRKFSKSPMSIEKLIEYGSISEEIAAILKNYVVAKYNIFVCGGTGSGKTTFLNALSNFIPHDERVITIEDSAELKITSIDNLVSLETRNSNSSSNTEITIRDLIKSSLRMRPDRIVVGEVRGAEAIDMLQAMNTGHDGSLSTGHANSAKDMLSRLETMVLTGTPGLPLQAIRQQVSSAIDIIIHLSRLRDKSRKTLEISEIVGLDERNNYIINKLYEFEEDEHATVEKVSGKLVKKNELDDDKKLKMAGIR